MTILDIQNIKKEYSNGKIALKGLTLSINSGEFIGLLGPNGAGKSTLINILSDIVIKTSGSATIQGFDLDKDKNLFKRSIGIVPQDINFDPFFNSFEILTFQQGLYGLKSDKKAILDLLERLGLSEYAYLNSRNLSGGMKRRLLIAKAMIHNPDVLILDEPTAGVDVELRQNLWSFLRELHGNGKTIILTTHYLEEAQALCDKIAVINKGELVVYEDKNTLIQKLGHKILELSLNKRYENILSLEEFNPTAEDLIVSFCHKKDSDVGIIVENIVKNGYKIEGIRTKESSLEEVFLKLTA